MINFKNSDFWKLLRPISSWKQFVSKKYWREIYSFLQAFIVLGDRRGLSQTWPHQCIYCGRNRQLLSIMRKVHLVSSDTTTLLSIYNTHKINAVCIFTLFLLWPQIPFRNRLLDCYNFNPNENVKGKLIGFFNLVSFVQNMALSKCLSKCIKVDKCDYLKNP